MKVFISYSRRDDAVVRLLVTDLKQARVQVWIDEELGGGDSWWTSILEQIRRCDVFIFALSDKSLFSKPCKAELAYAEALGLPILPVQIGDVASYHVDKIFTVQLIDYRHPTKQSGIDLVSALHAHAAGGTDLPDPLPEPPPIPYEYLHRLGSSIHDTGVPLSPPAQAQMLFELRSALSDEDDPIVLDDIRNLLRALRRRADVTYMVASEIDTHLRSGAPEDLSSPDAAAGDATAPPRSVAASVPASRWWRNRRATLVIAAAVVVVSVVALVLYQAEARPSQASRQVVAPSPTAPAPSTPAPATTGLPSRLTQYITDNAAALTDPGRGDVESAIDKLFADRGIRLWVVYVESFGAQGAVDWAKSMMQTGELGQGVALLAVATDHQWAFLLRGITGIDQTKMDSIHNVMRNTIGPAVSRSDYSAAAVAAANSLE
jgi:serine/threonine kinase PknH